MAVLEQAIVPSGMNQGDLVRFLSNVVTAVNALIDDHNTVIAKLNLDAGVTDTDYAAATATDLKLTAG